MMSSMSNMFMCNALSLLCIADDMLRNHKQNGDSDVSSSIDAVSRNSDSHCCSGRGPCGHLGQTKHVSVFVQGPVD